MRSSTDPLVVAAQPGFDRWREFLSVDWSTPAFRRAREALQAVRRFRDANGSLGGDYEHITLPVRVAAATFADEIQAAAGPEQDPATIAWVAAGLRCSSRPFCAGCPACQTVTSPLRPCTSRVQRW